MNTPACRNCRFYSAPGNAIGKCRVKAPVAISFGLDQGKSQWPNVEANDWCGEWVQGTSEKHLASEDNS